MAKDPICGMVVDPETAKFTSIRNGKRYYFCSMACRNKFASDTLYQPKKKGWFTRFLEGIAKENEEKFGGRPPSCCRH